MNNVQNISVATRTKASRARYSVKPQLKVLIDLINLVSPDQELKDLEELVEDERLQPNDEAWREQDLHRFDAFVHYLGSLPLLFRYAILGPIMKLKGTEDSDAVLSMIWDAEFRYQRFKLYRENLHRLAEIGKNPSPFTGRTLTDIPIEFIEYIRLDDEGKLRRNDTFFAEALDGVEVTRIRECEVCRRIFWASRKDAQCCSKEHAHVLRSRRSRSNWDEKKNDYMYARHRKEEKRKRLKCNARHLRQNKRGG